ncbi:MAG: T9SS type A sorting domain-containing protein [Ignavibacteria bacterium]|nr:T9SS type A sorting domain-containing protein [Ignavibacteria bacterium]
MLFIELHELTHSFFNFPDIEHAMGDSRWYGMGYFDLSQGFHNVPSLFNPLFRLKLGWANLTRITDPQTIEFKDFESDPNHPIYAIWNDETNPNEYRKTKFLLTYYDRSSPIYWNVNWPLPNTGNISEGKGILIWRWIDDGSNSYSFDNRLTASISLESAHGKWEWIDDTNMWTRKFRNIVSGEPIPNIVHGLDSLMVRGSYTWKESGIWKGSWNDFRIGSDNCFFSPYAPQDFSFYTNPSSNLVNQYENFGRNLMSGFALKNFRLENGAAKVDLVKGNDVYIVDKNSTIKADNLYIDRSITITNGAILKITGPSKIYLRNGSRIDVTNGGTLDAENVTFEYEPTRVSFGIFINNGGILKLKNSKILYSTFGVYGSIGTNEVRIENCEINSTIGAGIAIIDPIINKVYLVNNKINSQRYGILAVNLPAITIHGNQINARWGVWLYNTQNSNIVKNIITGNHNESIGIFALSSEGLCFKNKIQSFFRGAQLVKSSFKFGQNIISENFQHGLYLAEQSTANLAPDVPNLEGSSSLIYDAAGFNKIFNNGQMDYSFGDNSEIYIDNSALIFNGNERGYNSVKDDRVGLPFSTLYLISGTRLFGASSTLNAKYTYWGNNPDFPPPFDPTGRFLNINVAYIPYLTSEPIPPVGRPEYRLLIDLNNNILDTIYARDVGLINISILEELLAQANQMFDERLYNDAKELYSYIIENYGDEAESISAYFRMLAILKLLGATSSEYAYYIQQFEDNLIAISDTLMQDFIEGIKISYQVSAEEYIDALSQLEHIILSNPETDEEFYASLEILMVRLLNYHPPAGLGKSSQEHYSTIESLNQKVDNLFSKKFSSDKIIIQNLQTAPMSYDLSQNYPNPFNPTTKIRYSIKESGPVALKIFDILGREVAVLVNEPRQAGEYEVEFDAGKYGLSSGIYLYRLTVNSFSSTKKFVYLR